MMDAQRRILRRVACLWALGCASATDSLADGRRGVFVETMRRLPGVLEVLLCRANGDDKAKHDSPARERSISGSGDDAA